MTRVRAMVAKEFIDLRRNRAALLPIVLIMTLSLVVPFGITIGVPLMSGQALSDDPDLARVSMAVGRHDELSSDGVIELFLFEQFLLLFLLTPVTGAMALAAHAKVGEKQPRTLKPLLATPVTTGELLVAKVLGAFAPTLLISFAGLAIYFAGIALLADSGVLQAMLTMRTAMLVAVVGPAAALVSLQSAIVISSRVNDARTAQQFGVLIILPLTALLVAQFVGTVWLSAAGLAWIGLGLIGMWLLLLVASVALFERESILTRWR
jgi:ABC-2 type transport system permease protein